jgi:hypothetical protein
MELPLPGISRLMRTLIYKRTHSGDPGVKGHFGVGDCMGRLRQSPFDAVIGIGGIGPEPVAEGISGRVNWIGIGARKHPLSSGPSPLITFDHFVLFEEKGVDFCVVAPTLARRMYSRHPPRFLFNDHFSKEENAEVLRVLKMARNAPSSTRTQISKDIRCSPKRC